MIWVLAGTADSHQIIKELASLDKDLIISVTSNYGKNLYKSRYPFKVYQGKYNLSKMKGFCQRQNVETIIDVTHPFAEQASKNAIASAAELNLDYIRFERKELNLDKYSKDIIIKVKTYQEAAQKASQYENIFLTTGSKTLDIFIKRLENYQKRLIARILPVTKYLESAYNSGLKPVNILAAQGPFSSEFNKAAFKEYNADVIVTKAAGQTGGLAEKLEAASQLKLPVIIIKRPVIDYPVCYNNVDSIIEYLEGMKNEERKTTGQQKKSGCNNFN